jgi:UDP-3-O-[3-hydroxymyristoyl] glucosamine N-acyltransferase
MLITEQFKIMNSNNKNMTDLVVLGSGNVDIVRLIEDINQDEKRFNFIGFLEKDEKLINKEVLGYPILGTDDLLLDKLSGCAVVNNIIGTTRLHEIVSNNINNKYKIYNTPNLIHPKVCRKYVNIGKGNIIYENIGFATKVSIGDFNIIYPGTNIGHETSIGDFNLLALNVVIGARCTIGSRNLFGNSSTLSLGLSMANDNSVGVGSVIIKSIESGNSLLGNPAMDSISLFKSLIKDKKI